MAELSREEIKKFRQLISMIELRDVLITAEKFKKYKANPSKKLSVGIKQGQANLRLTESLVAECEYTISIKSGRSKFFELFINFEIHFDVSEVEIVKNLLSNENISAFFKDLQLAKIVWPFLREEFHSATGKAGLRPFTLPFLK